MILKYCRRCGESLIKEASYFVCRNSHPIFENPVPATGILFLNPNKDKVLLAVRALEPFKGMLDTPGGFIDPNESAEECIKREIQEELNLNSEQYINLSYLTSTYGLYPYKGEELPVISIIFTATLQNDTQIQSMDDVDSVKWFNIDKIPLDKIGSQEAKQAVNKLIERLNDR